MNKPIMKKIVLILIIMFCGIAQAAVPTDYTNYYDCNDDVNSSIVIDMKADSNGTIYGPNTFSFTKNNTDIYAEAWRQQVNCYYIYIPDGNDGYFRWRILTAKDYRLVDEDTAYSLCGAVRGKVYSGQQWLYTQADTNGTWTVSASANMTSGANSSYTSYLSFAVPAGMDKVRVFGQAGTTRDKQKFSFYDSVPALISEVNVAETSAASTVAGCSYWYDIPANTATVRVSKATNNAVTVRVSGIDLIDLDTITTPNEPNSLMYDGADGETLAVVDNDDLLSFTDSGITASTTDLALYWDADGGTSASIGGIGHRGIKFDGTATVTWSYKTTGEETTWTPTSGSRITANNIYLRQLGGDAYDSADYSGAVLSTDGVIWKYEFDSYGVAIDINIVPTVDVDMFILYSEQLPFPTGDVNQVMFYRDTQVYTFSAAIKSLFPTRGVFIWGGVNNTLYHIYDVESLSNADYFNIPDANNYPRVVADPEKFYSNKFINSSDPCDVPAGASIYTRFRIDLATIESCSHIVTADSCDISTTGRTNNAFNLDGSFNYVDCNSTFQANASTFNCWVMPDAGRPLSKQVIISRYVNDGNHFEVYLDTTGYFDANCFVNGVEKTVSLIQDGHSTLQLADGAVSEWIMLAATMADCNLNSATGNVLIGKSNSGEYFKGGIDEIKVYDRVLSLTEIQQLFIDGGGVLQSPWKKKHNSIHTY